MRALLAIAAFAVTGLSFAALDPPTPSAAKDAAKQQSHSRKADNEPDTSKSETKTPSIQVNVSPTINNGKPHSDKADQGNNPPHENRWLEITFIGITALATILLAVFTWRLWVSTDRLWEEAKAASGIAKKSSDTLVAQMRAFVSIESAQIQGFNEDGPCKIQINLINSGESVAYDVIWEGGVTIREAAVSQFIGDLRPVGSVPVRRSKSTLAKGASSGGFLEIPAQHLTKEEKNAIRNGQKGIFIYGKITYRDALKNPRFTDYRKVFGGEPGISPNGAFAICDEGNDAD